MLRARDLADVGLAVAAQRLVELSLGIVPGERVLLVHDAAHEEIVTVVADAVREARAEPILMRLDSFGVNLGLTTPLGDVFSDQKIPGVHLSFGDPFATETGATWTCRSWLALTSVGHDADLDKLQVLRGGRYIL